MNFKNFSLGALTIILIELQQLRKKAKTSSEAGNYGSMQPANFTSFLRVSHGDQVPKFSLEVPNSLKYIIHATRPLVIMLLSAHLSEMLQPFALLPKSRLLYCELLDVNMIILCVHNIHH